MLEFAILFGIWPFVSTGLLWWGLAASAPLAIHLWNRRKYERENWAAMPFLLTAMRKNSRRIRMEQLLLLAIRTLILLIFVAAIANPMISFFSSFGTSLGTKGHTHYMLVLDGSYSMNYRQDEQSRFETAQELALQLVDNSQQGDGFTLLLMANKPHVVIAEPAFDPADVREEIYNLQLHHAGARLQPTLNEISRLLTQTTIHQPRLTETKLCFFSDLCQTTWESTSEAEVRHLLEDLATNAEFILLDVGQAADNNLAITSLFPTESLITVGRPISWEVGINNVGTQNSVNPSVGFFVDGKRVQAEAFEVDAKSSTSVRFRHKFISAGEHMVEARLSEDPLNIDNHRWFSLPVRESVRVLCIAGKPGSADNVAFALEPFEHELQRVQCEIVSETAIMEKELPDYDAVVLCNVGRISREEATVLSDFVHAGGGLVVFLGDQVQAESYNQYLGPDSQTPILPTQIGDIISTSGNDFGVHLEAGNFSHPLAAPFREVPGSGLFTIPSYCYFKLIPNNDVQDRVAFSFQNQDIAVIESFRGRGRCFLFATAASIISIDNSQSPAMPWTALPTVKDFVSLWQEMLSLLLSERYQERNVLVGERLEGNERGATPGTSITIHAPDSRTRRTHQRSLQEVGSNAEWSYENTFWSGQYNATTPDKSPTNSGIYAVNIDPTESDLRRFDANLLPHQFQRGFQHTPNTQSLNVASPKPIFRELLGCVFILLLTESILACRFGSRA